VSDKAEPDTPTTRPLRTDSAGSASAFAQPTAFCRTAAPAARRLVNKPIRHYLAAVPSAVAIFVVLWVAVAMKTQTGAAPLWYQPTADAAYAAGDYRTAAVCYERLLQSRPSDQAIALNLAQSLRAIGQLDSASSLMARIAPEDQLGYEPAQLAVVRRILGEDAPSALSLDSAEKHLAQALKVSADDPQAIDLLIELFAWRGQWDMVEKYTGNLGPASSSLRERLLAIAKREGNSVEAQRWSQGAALGY